MLQAALPGLPLTEAITYRYNVNYDCTNADKGIKGWPSPFPWNGWF